GGARPRRHAGGPAPGGGRPGRRLGARGGRGGRPCPRSGRRPGPRGPGPEGRAQTAAQTPPPGRRRQAPQTREVALMGMLGWVMMGLALWHFTIWLPDRFWGGIVGALIGSLGGSIP